jgi:predicted ATPase
MAVILGGWALVQRGRAHPGIEQMRLGLQAFQAMGGTALSSYFSGLLAEAYAATGQTDQALGVLSGVDEEIEPWWKAERYRLRGEILACDLQGSRSVSLVEAEEYFRRAIDIAKTQNAKSLELRATMSLSRLWQAQSKHSEARRFLKKIVGRFSEGFGTRDLREAQVLIEQCE